MVDEKKKKGKTWTMKKWKRGGGGTYIAGETPLTTRYKNQNVGQQFEASNLLDCPLIG